MADLEAPGVEDVPSSPQKPIRTNYVLIDFENLQPSALDLLTHECLRVIVFVGASQPRIPIEVVISLQRLGPRAEYVKICGNGPNALDFHIAFYIGALAFSDPTAYFHIMSRDTGFDPLICHLREKKVHVARRTSITDIPVVKRVVDALIRERSELVVSRLRDVPATRPRTVPALANQIGTWFRGRLSEDEIAALIQDLDARNILKINDSKVEYALPTNS